MTRFAVAGGDPDHRHTGGAIAACWTIDATTSFAGAIDAAGTAGTAFDIAQGATAIFEPGSGLFAATLLDIAPYATVAGNAVVVGDATPGTLTAETSALTASSFVIANQAGAGGSSATLYNSALGASTVVVGNQAYGLLDLIATGWGNGLAGTLAIGEPGALGVVVGLSSSLEGTINVGAGGTGEFATTAGIGSNAFTVSTGSRVDLNANGIYDYGLVQVDAGGVIAGQDWELRGTSGAIVENDGTIKATSGSGSTQDAVPDSTIIETVQIQGQGTLLMPARRWLWAISPANSPTPHPTIRAQGNVRAEGEL